MALLGVAGMICDETYFQPFWESGKARKQNIRPIQNWIWQARYMLRGFTACTQ